MERQDGRVGGPGGGGSGGFTLLEVLIALAILAVALLSLLGAQAQCLRNSTSAERLTMAVLVAREEMSRILLSFPDVGEEEGEFGEEHKGFKWRREVLLPPEPVPGDMVHEIHLTVIWLEGDLVRSYELTSYAANLAAL